MITLTTPPSINVVIGGNTQVSYNKFVVAPFTMDGITQRITATVVVTATATPEATPITGTLTIDVPGGNLFLLRIPDLDITLRKVLTGPQATAIINAIETSQAAIENGLITLNAVAGTRSAGV